MFSFQARLRALGVSICATALAWGPFTAQAQVPEYSDAVQQATGQTVFFNAWGGDERINAYIAWAGDRLAEDHGIELRHVKLSNTADAVARVRAEVQSGLSDDGGSVDLIWINGENFAAMKREGLLFGPFAPKLPNMALVDTQARPTTVMDFTIPTDGLESPWGMAQFNFLADTALVPATAFSDLDALAQWAQDNPGRFSYPLPPDFLGSTFLKQILVEKVDADFSKAFDGDASQFAPVFAYLDDLHPNLWRQGTRFPASGPRLRDLLANGEVDVALSFNPSEAASLVLNDEVAPTVQALGLGTGTIANSHFVAIPVNASAHEAAMVAANFLLSPQAQARKASLTYWGDPTVLSLDRLDDAGRALFAAEPTGNNDIGPALTEPDPSWMAALEAAWEARYGS